MEEEDKVGEDTDITKEEDGEDGEDRRRRGWRSLRLERRRTWMGDGEGGVLG